MNNLAEKITYKSHKIEIIHDEYPDSPNNWRNDDAFIVYDHRDFSVERKFFSPDSIFEKIKETGNLFYEGYFVFPLYAYIHSGVSLSINRNNYPFNDRWDVSYRGFVLVRQQKGWSYHRSKALKSAESVVEEWNTYLSGEVYGYKIFDQSQNELDSCWGYYGLKYCIEEAKSIVDYYAAKALENHISRLKAWIKNRVPFMYRESLQLQLT